MTDLETRLAAALQADVPPSRDAVFRVDVLVRLERARFRRRVARAVVVATLLAALAGLNLPVIGAWTSAAGQRLWPVALGGTALLYVCVALMMIRPGFRTVANTVGRVLYP